MKQILIQPHEMETICKGANPPVELAQFVRLLANLNGWVGKASAEDGYVFRVISRTNVEVRLFGPRDYVIISVVCSAGFPDQLNAMRR